MIAQEKEKEEREGKEGEREKRRVWKCREEEKRRKSPEGGI